MRLSVRKKQPRGSAYTRRPETRAQGATVSDDANRDLARAYEYEATQNDAVCGTCELMMRSSAPRVPCRHDAFLRTSCRSLVPSTRGCLPSANASLFSLETQTVRLVLTCVRRLSYFGDCQGVPRARSHACFETAEIAVAHARIAR